MEAGCAYSYGDIERKNSKSFKPPERVRGKEKKEVEEPTQRMKDKNQERG
jgi:hypothetical protein